MTPPTHSPLAYARYLAGYISDPSTIHIMTKREWGRAPDLDRCRHIRQRVMEERQREVEVMVARAVPLADKQPREFFQCGHERAMENVAFKGDNEICRTCLDKKRKAMAWQRYAARLEEARQHERKALLDVADLDLAEIIAPSRRAIVSAARIYGVAPALVVSKNRKRSIVRARWAVMLALRSMGEDRYSLTRIGTIVGINDHATVIYGLREAEFLVERDSYFAEVVRTVTEVAKMPVKPIPQAIVNRYIREPELVA